MIESILAYFGYVEESKIEPQKPTQDVFTCNEKPPICKKCGWQSWSVKRYYGTTFLCGACWMDKQ